MTEFHPTNSVTGSILSQEIQKIVVRHGRPFYGLFVYDIKDQTGEVYPPKFLQNILD